MLHVESSQQGQEGRGARRPEVIVLTLEDRERISRLAQEIGGNALLSFCEGERRTRLVNKLREEGRKAAAFILETILSGSAPLHTSYFSGETEPSFFHYVHWLRYCASSHEAEKIGDALIRDEVCLDGDRSNKVELLDVLKKVGTSANTEHLVAFVEKIANGRPYEGDRRFEHADMVNARWVISAILGRTTVEEERQKLQDADRRIAEIITTVGVFSEQRPEARRPEFFILDEHDPLSERLGDEILTEGYKGRRFAESESRLEVVKRLRHETRKEGQIKEEPEDDDTLFLRRHFLDYREGHPPLYTPTLGIEIEIREDTVLPERLHKLEEKFDEGKISDRNYSRLSKERDEFLEKKRLQYRKTEEAGVPRRFDKFWEFAHRPVQYYLTLSREVQALFEMDLINREDQEHALHLTIGGITSGKDIHEYEAFGKEAFVLIRALEATAWSTRGRRLLRPYFSKTDSWTAKGQAGVKERHPSELELGTPRAVEFRTFQLQTVTGLDRLLRSAFLLGAALKAYQEEKGYLMPPEVVDEEARKELAQIWRGFSARAREIFLNCGLTDPQVIWKDPRPLDKEQSSEFVPLAELIDGAISNPESQGSKFVREIRKLIIATRARIAKILYPEEKIVVAS